MATQELQRSPFKIDWDNYVVWYNTALCLCGHFAMDHGNSRGCWEFDCKCERRYWVPWADMDLKSRGLRTLAIRGLADDELKAVHEVERTKMARFMLPSRINPEVIYVPAHNEQLAEFVLKHKPRHELEGGLPFHHAWDWNTKRPPLELRMGKAAPIARVWR